MRRSSCLNLEYTTSTFIPPLFNPYDSLSLGLYWEEAREKRERSRTIRQEEKFMSKLLVN